MIYLKSRNVDEDIRPVWVVSGDSEEVNDKRFNVVSVNRCIREFPMTIQDRISSTLQNLYGCSPHFGAILPIMIGNIVEKYWLPVTFSQNEEEYLYFVKTLIKMDLLEQSDPRAVVSPLKLTFRAVDKLDTDNNTSNSKQGFIAMCQNPLILPDWEILQRDGLIKGIETAGFNALSVTEYQFNGDIHDEVIRQIKQSRFIVADVSGALQNVYYEAGFAEGLGLPVIYTCNEKYVNEVHFDIRQRKLIVWSDIYQLAKDITRRIEATIGRGPIQ